MRLEGSRERRESFAAFPVLEDPEKGEIKETACAKAWGDGVCVVVDDWRR